MEEYKIQEITTPDGQKYHIIMKESLEKESEIYFSLPNNNFPLTEIAKVITTINNSAIYFIPDIPSAEISEAIQDNDNKLYNKLLLNINLCTYDIYNRLKDKTNIKQTIGIICLTEEDRKFAGWLEINKANYQIHGIKYEELQQMYNKLVEYQNDAFDGTPLSGPTEGDTKDNAKPYVKKLIPPKPSGGFTNILSITLIISIAIVLGITIANLIIK